MEKREKEKNERLKNRKVAILNQCLKNMTGAPIVKHKTVRKPSSKKLSFSLNNSKRNSLITEQEFKPSGRRSSVLYAPITLSEIKAQRQNELSRLKSKFPRITTEDYVQGSENFVNSQKKHVGEHFADMTLSGKELLHFLRVYDPYHPGKEIAPKETIRNLEQVSYI